LRPKSTFPIHPHPHRLYNRYFSISAPHFLSSHESPSKLAESRYPPRKGPVLAIFIRKAVFKRPLSPTIFFLPTQMEVRLFVLARGDFCGASSCIRTGCRQVARYMHDPNGIIDARSVSPLAPDLVAVISDEGLWNLDSSLSPV